jgi:hypothetical protein
MNQAQRVDLATLRDTAPDGVISSSELRAAGVSSSTVATRCRPLGPWQRVLPGVLLLSSARPTTRQRLRAAVTYAGETCVITGMEALRQQGIPLGRLRAATGRPAAHHPDEVHLLVAAHRRLASREYVLVERTTRMPEPVWRNGFACAPVARAVLDMARRQQDPAVLRRVLFDPVMAGACTLTQLRAELEAGSQRGTAAPRALLHAALADVLPIASARARRLVAAAPLPPPRWNASLRTASGLPLGTVDAWWHEVALAWDHGGHGDDNADGNRWGALESAGALLLRTPPEWLHGDPERVVRELVAAFLDAAKRPRPPVYAGAVPA